MKQDSNSNFLFFQPPPPKKYLRIYIIFIYCNLRQLICLMKFSSFPCFIFSWIAITALIDSSFTIVSGSEMGCANISLAANIQFSATLVFLPGTFVSYVSVVHLFFSNYISMSDTGVHGIWDSNASTKSNIFSVTSVKKWPLWVQVSAFPLIIFDSVVAIDLFQNVW